MRRGSENLLVALALSAALALALPALAGADIGAKIILRCTHGQSLSGFSQKDYKRALEEMPIEVREYNDCEELIQQAELAAAGRGGSTGIPGSEGGEGGEGASIGNQQISMTPEEQQAVASAAKNGSAPVRVGPHQDPIAPGVVHANIASAVSSLPAPLLAVLALMLACALGVGAQIARKRMLREHHADADSPYGED